MARKKPTIVSLDADQIKWLENKVEEGYSKSGLIRLAVKRLMAEPDIKSQVKEIEIKPDTEDSKPAKKVEIDRILEVLIEMSESGKMGKYGTPDMIDAAKRTREQLRNIEHLSPQSAFELGKFKVEMENMFNKKLQKELNKPEFSSIKDDPL